MAVADLIAKPARHCLARLPEVTIVAMPTMVNVDGRLSGEREAVVSVFDHGFLFGEGVYEVMRTYRQRPFLYEPHMRRLRASADRIALPAHEEVEPVVGDELDREVPLGRRDGVLERLRAHPARGVPARGASVQRGELSRQLALRAGAQQLREQAVVAVPLAARVDPERFVREFAGDDLSLIHI